MYQYISLSPWARAIHDPRDFILTNLNPLSLREIQKCMAFGLVSIFQIAEQCTKGKEPLSPTNVRTLLSESFWALFSESFL